MMKKLPFSALRQDAGGVAFVEFAYALPIFLGLAMTGLELTHYVTTRMRVNQVALHLADHASRMGEGAQLAAKTISEKQINDAFVGAALQGGNLDILSNGRLILSSLEEMPPPNTPTRYRIRWQRCRGSLTYTSAHGVSGATDLTGIGPATRQVTTPAGSATMFVEVRYRYQPVIAGDYIPAVEFSEIASMTVRDRRDLSQVYNAEAVTPSNCT
jgi:hypothetical protein